VHQRERRLAGVEGLQGQVQHHGGVFADGIEHDGVVELGGNFPDYVDALGFQLFEMGQVVRGHGHPFAQGATRSMDNPL